MNEDQGVEILITILNVVFLSIIGEATVSNIVLGTTMYYTSLLIEVSQVLVLTVLFNTKTPANSKPVFVSVLRIVNFDFF